MFKERKRVNVSVNRKKNKLPCQKLSTYFILQRMSSGMKAIIELEHMLSFHALWILTYSYKRKRPYGHNGSLQCICVYNSRQTAWNNNNIFIIHKIVKNAECWFNWLNDDVGLIGWMVILLAECWLNWLNGDLIGWMLVKLAKRWFNWLDNGLMAEWWFNWLDIDLIDLKLVQLARCHEMLCILGWLWCHSWSIVTAPNDFGNNSNKCNWINNNWFEDKNTLSVRTRPGLWIFSCETYSGTRSYLK